MKQNYKLIYLMPVVSLLGLYLTKFYSLHLTGVMIDLSPDVPYMGTDFIDTKQKIVRSIGYTYFSVSFVVWAWFFKKPKSGISTVENFLVNLFCNYSLMVVTFWSLLAYFHSDGFVVGSVSIRPIWVMLLLIAFFILVGLQTLRDIKLNK